MSGFKTTRRFIAGAVCPRCSQMERIVVDMETDRRECVACGFRDERPEDKLAREVPNRVSRTAARRVETPAETVRLVDPAVGKTSGDGS